MYINLLTSKTIFYVHSKEDKWKYTYGIRTDKGVSYLV